MTMDGPTMKASLMPMEVCARLLPSNAPAPWDIGGGGGALEGNNRAQTSIRISDAFNLGPCLVPTAQAGYPRWTQEGTHPSFDQTTLGFSKSLVSAMQQQIFPQFNNSDMYYIGTSEGQWFEHTNTYSYNFGVTKMWGSHNMKFGFQGQVKQNNSVGANRPGGQYNFDRSFHPAEPVCYPAQPGQRNRQLPAWQSQRRSA